MAAPRTDPPAKPPDDAAGADDDARTLSKLGYSQELLRAMGGFSSFALSFSIISVLTGIVTTYGTAIGGAGPVALGLGWPLVSAGTLLVALAMGELASAFPTAGALYHWSAILGGRGWGWMTAAMNLVGQCAIVAAIDVGCADTFAATIDHRPWFPAILAAVFASHWAINVFSVRLVAWLNDLSATVHLLGVVALVGLLLAAGRRHPWSWLFHGGFTVRADHATSLGFVNALLLGMWTFTGFDASAHVSEETRDPARRAPWGIVLAVGVSAVAGFALAAAITLAIGDLDATARDDSPALFVLRGALGESRGRAAMLLAVGAMWFCGLSSVTSASRMLYAFARDGGVPFAAPVATVGPRLKTPHVAVTCAAVFPLLLVVVVRNLSDRVFNVVVTLSTTGLYVSYGLPIALGAVARHRGAWTRRGPWHLGRFGVPVAWAAVAWTLFVLFACAVPAIGASGEPTNPMAGATLAAVVAALGVAYVVFARPRFRGPPIDLASFETRR